MNTPAALVTLAGFGAWHGLNPAMGWLFAVARGMQAQSGRVVAASLGPIALGHAAAVALAVALFAAGRFALPFGPLRYATAALVVAFGALKLVRPKHPRWVGMRLGPRELALWSFLMATAHGAGLMILPIFLLGEGAEAPPCRGECVAAPGLDLTGWAGYLVGVGVHTGAMLAASGLVALVVYYRVGLAVLRRAWWNLDPLWALGLIASGALALWL
ncbi:MAG TPA: hypothetical protein VFS43_15640 [Polyangiaceae bacterium]|nr:hypothetical protein [Polyangiaceae bacterium]